MTFVDFLSNYKFSTLQITLIAAGIGVWLFIYTPLAIYHSKKYYSNRNHIVYKARYAKITIYEATFVVIKILYSCFANAVWVIMITDDANDTYGFVAQVADIGDTILAYFVIYSWIWRIWMISYNMIWTKSVMNHEWKQIINLLYSKQSIASSHSFNWYLTNKKTYGNYKWVQWRLLLLVILSSSINVVGDLVSVYYFEKNDELLYLFQISASIPWILPYIALIIIWCITPKYIDNFYVLKELKYVFLCLCFDYFVGYMCYMLIMAFYRPQTADFTRVIESISFHLTLTAQFTELMVATWWVNRKVVRIINDGRYKEVNFTSINSYTSNKIKPGMVASSEDSMNKKLITVQPKKSISTSINKEYDSTKLKDILCYDYGVESFIEHLSSEFAIECILSLIEMLQFQKYIAVKIDYQRVYVNYDDQTDGRLFCDMINFPQTVPLSHIVYDERMSSQEKAVRLYEKYVKIGAEFEINLSFAARKKLDIFQEKTVEIQDQQLLMIFNEPCQQMVSLMKDSFNRWKLTTQYDKCIQDILH